jgi:site-specific DNA-methyltransferase (adenine-specific)
MTSFHDKLPNPIQKIGEPQIVKTPELLVSNILDSFPNDIWSNKNKRWLVPVSKTGVFEIGIYNRLMDGLAAIIPDWEERRTWIIKEMIWSFCPTRACEYIVRRNYLGKVCNNLSWQNLEGNVQTLDFLSAKLGEDGKVMVKKEIDGKETYMKFHNIVGNPPYQKNSGDTSDVAFYPAFVEKAIKMKPEYMSMVIPAKWMMGDGKGTAGFLKTMLTSKKIASIVSIENSRDWFPDIDLKGGAMYFLWSSSKDDSITSINGNVYDMSDSDVIITDAIALSIKDKILSKFSKCFDAVMYGQNPYGINTNHSEWCDINESHYICHCSGGGGKGEITKLVSKKLITKNVDTIDKWKLCIAKNSGKGRDGTGHSFLIAPGAITTQSYLVFGTFSTENEANNAYAYLNTRFAQFMSSILKGTQNVSKRVFKWLPYLDFSRSYTDQDLYTMFDLSTDEIAHIENTTKDFPIFKVKALTSKMPKKSATR